MLTPKTIRYIIALRPEVTVYWWRQNTCARSKGSWLRQKSIYWNFYNSLYSLQIGLYLYKLSYYWQLRQWSSAIDRMVPLSNCLAFQNSLHWCNKLTYIRQLLAECKIFSCIDCFSIILCHNKAYPRILWKLFSLGGVFWRFLTCLTFDITNCICSTSGLISSTFGTYAPYCCALIAKNFLSEISSKSLWSLNASMQIVTQSVNMKIRPQIASKTFFSSSWVNMFLCTSTYCVFRHHHFNLI